MLVDINSLIWKSSHFPRTETAMAKRLSSLFSLSRDDKQHSEVVEPDSIHHAQSPTYVAATTSHKLSKHRVTSSTIDLTAGASSLAPPPLLSEPGFVRPPSSHRSGSESRPGSRTSSAHSYEGSRSRPQTPTLLIPSSTTASPARPTTPSSAKLSKKKSWIPTRHDRHKGDDGQGPHKAWIAGLREHVPYDLGPLLRGDKVPELWNERGDTLIYLYPPESQRGPCFRIDSALLADSSTLVNLRMQSPTSPADQDGDLMRVQSAFSDTALNPRPGRPPSQHSQASSTYRPAPNFSIPNLITLREEKHLYLPLGFEGNMLAREAEPQGDDLELVVLYRNFFAFLAGGALVATPRLVTLYAIFLGISTILKRFCFSNSDGSTFGEVPSNSFARYCEELRLADVRSSREKTIEAIVLGEQLRSWPLYNEGFSHAVGRLTDIKSINSPKYAKMSGITVNRLERSHLDMEQRLLAVRAKLEDFEFPSMFAGIANSQTSTEAKLVRFKEWKAGFLDFRRFTLSYYRRKYGAWPPKASSKKNNFEESGLNRLLLLELYKDFTDLYDILVDRSAITTRTADMPAMDDDAETNDQNETIQHAIRRVESEYDRATPPVVPPIPFDTPLIPQFSQSFNRDHVVVSDQSALHSRKLKENEVNEVLLGSYNRESIAASPWIQDFFTYERRLGSGKTLEQIVDARCGQWLFMYAILQALPMTVVDARDLKHTEGVEYFLCVGPRGGRPWMREDQSTSRAWYNVASGGGVVSLPADLIDHSVEGIYRRSHCWTEATKWTQASVDGALGPVPAETVGLQLPSPAAARTGYRSPRQQSPYASPLASPLLRPHSPNDIHSSRDRSSVNLGLEALEEPPPRQTSRPTSVFNPNITFDAILGTNDEPQTKAKKGKKGKK
ncbi:hypothetical protein HRR80_003405 [Exophiala dermatitidis]|uniref:DUF8004 domain-containing protein n=2 Tax=Exophiala dermatitidis TaxID=5970 RepID=H6C031_EXODN|nr:uncharacterized protein HMPREF1120_05228 [Exophiala dermatitidis NIH/UT8656]EHY57180.1 hypothetical protein HMPREF1120_05228 [Exophiala dermatitidis NIH/UT8656]KAJ8993382.1 hypothetical protein HRR80_003405 [Exophiala dermatitidis]